MPPSTLIQSVVFKPSKRKGVFYEMSSTCPVCKLKCSRKGVMLRHKRNKHGSTHPYPQSSDVYPPLRRTLLYFENQQSLHILRFRRIRSRSFHAVGPSICQCNLGTNRKWKIRICQEIRTQYQTHDDPNTDRFLWCYGEYQTVYGTVDGVDFQQGLPDLDTLDPREKTFNHPRRPHGRNGSKSSFFVYEEESPQKHQCHVHRSESVSSRKTP